MQAVDGSGTRYASPAVSEEGSTEISRRGGTMITHTGNPYEAVDLTQPRSRDDGRRFKRFVVALFSFFIAFWAGAITLLVCVVLREKGIL